MKKSRIAKLALMGASITALAATLTTSTYAWYVSNKTANVTAATGATAAGASDGSISLSTSGVADEFYKTITLESVDNFNAYVASGASSVKLEPVKTSDGLNFYQPVHDDDAGTWSDGTAVTGKNFYFMFYVKAAADCKIKPTITVTNKTTTVPTAIDYSAHGNIAGSAVDGKDYTVDAIHSLHMSLVSTESGSTGGYSASGAIAATAKIGAVEGAYGVVTKISTAIDAYARKATGGAHTYFTEIMGYAPNTSAPAYTAAAFTDIQLHANKPTMLEYRVWLDGGDDQCFNPCVNQTFDFEFSYTITA